MNSFSNHTIVYLWVFLVGSSIVGSPTEGRISQNISPHQSLFLEEGLSPVSATSWNPIVLGPRTQLLQEAALANPEIRIALQTAQNALAMEQDRRHLAPIFEFYFNIETGQFLFNSLTRRLSHDLDDQLFELEMGLRKGIQIFTAELTQIRDDLEKFIQAIPTAFLTEFKPDVASNRTHLEGLEPHGVLEISA